MMKISLGIDICNSILFCHALLGRITTSHIHNVGKENAIGKFNENVAF